MRREGACGQACGTMKVEEVSNDMQNNNYVH